MHGMHQLPGRLLQSGIVPKGTRVYVFERIYWVFIALATLVGIVVIAYMLYNAYKYRDGSEAAGKGDVARPTLGELPEGSGGGRKLFMSFALSAIIVVSLIAWTYGTLRFTENPEQEQALEAAKDPLVVDVVGYQFGWRFEYPNGKVVDSGAGDAFVVPADRMVRLNVTSRDVMHNFGIPGLRAKTDAIPGQTTSTWFIAEEPGATHTARCYELCGAGHSAMQADVEVMAQDEFQDWLEGSDETATPTSTTTATNSSA